MFNPPTPPAQPQIALLCEYVRSVCGSQVIQDACIKKETKTFYYWKKTQSINKNIHTNLQQHIVTVPQLSRALCRVRLQLRGEDMSEGQGAALQQDGDTACRKMTCIYYWTPDRSSSILRVQQDRKLRCHEDRLTSFPFGPAYLL